MSRLLQAKHKLSCAEYLVLLPRSPHLGIEAKLKVWKVSSSKMVQGNTQPWPLGLLDFFGIQREVGVLISEGCIPFWSALAQTLTQTKPNRLECWHYFHPNLASPVVLFVQHTIFTIMTILMPSQHGFQIIWEYDIFVCRIENWIFKWKVAKVE